MSRPTSGSPGAELPGALLDPCAWPGGRGPDDLVETHISWVYLRGDEAYKVKKPVRFAFLDFSTLERRRHFCEEELRINRRLAPGLYLGLSRITRAGDGLTLDGNGVTVDYAVRMRRFDRNEELDALIRHDDADPDLLMTFGRDLARLQRDLPVMPPGGDVPGGGDTLAACRENFDTLERLELAVQQAREVAVLRRWTDETHGRLAPAFARRRAAGRVRECHGDLHCGNVVRHGGKLLAFDALEFDPALRWIDVASDLAFLTMDLEARRRPDLRAAMLDGWLTEGGDFAALEVLRFHEVYRAMVRAKVAAIRTAQAAAAPGADGLADLDLYLATAAAFARPPRPLLVVMTGLSGSGKSWLASRLLGPLGAVRIRSDVERKRLHGYDPEQPSGGAIYDAQATEATYARLGMLARQALGTGFSVVIDAACLLKGERSAFVSLAEALDVPCRIVAVEADDATLRNRLASRALAGRDPSEADASVLDLQLRAVEPLGDDERDIAIAVRTADVDVAALARGLAASIRGRPGGPIAAAVPPAGSRDGAAQAT